MTPDQRAQAACRDHPDVNFFPDRGESTGPAKLICFSCPVRAACALLGAREKYGVWGGLSDPQRRQERPPQRRPNLSERIEAYIRAKGRAVTVREVATAMSAHPPTTHARLRDLASEGRLERVQLGVYRIAEEAS